VIFLSCKSKARVYDAKSGHGAFPAQGASASLKRLTNVAYATETVWAQNPDSQPTNQILSLPQLIYASEALVFSKSVNALSLTLKSLALVYSPVRVKVSVIEPSDAVKRRNG